MLRDMILPVHDHSPMRFVDMTDGPFVEINLDRVTLKPERWRTWLGLGEYFSDWVLMALMQKDALAIDPMPSSPEEDAMMKACRKLCREYINKHLARMNPQYLASLIGVSIVQSLLKELPTALEQAAGQLAMKIGADTDIQSGAVTIMLTGWMHRVPLKELDEKAIVPK